MWREMRFGALLAIALLIPALAEGASPNWKRGAPLPLARGEVAAAVDQGRIYIIGGFTANGQGSTRAEAYLPTTGTWSMEADLPVPVHHTMAAGYRGRVYVAGGYGPDHGQLTTLFAFTGDGWTRLATMPEDRAAVLQQAHFRTRAGGAGQRLGGAPGVVRIGRGTSFRNLFFDGGDLHPVHQGLRETALVDHFRIDPGGARGQRRQDGEKILLTPRHRMEMREGFEPG